MSFSHSAIARLNVKLDQMGPALQLPGPADVVRGRELIFRPPGSKSLTNRALLLAALTSGHSTLRGALIDADDTQRMIEALRMLGAEVHTPGNAKVSVWGVGGRWRVGPHGVRLNLQNAGTATRFLAASSLLSPGPITIDGNDRMRERPINALVEALRTLGCSCMYEGKEGCPPVTIQPALQPANDVTISNAASSQFISALLLAGTFLPGGLTIRVEGAVQSASYIRMTLWLLATLGATVQSSDDMRVLRVKGITSGSGVTGLNSFEHDIEPDASGATYLWGAGALIPGMTVRVLGLSHNSPQGDVHFTGELLRMGADVTHTGNGAESEIDVRGSEQLRPVLSDMSDMPDAAMTLAVLACFAPGTSILRGLRTLRVKETDRIEALRVELTKLAVAVETHVQGDDDAITITPSAGGVRCDANAPLVTFDTYDDHRMAMALSLVALRRPNVVINNPACVSKTYPGYWRDFARFFGA